MLPTSLARALETLHGVIEDSRVAETLAPLGLYSSLPRPSGNSLLQCFARIAVGQEAFGDIEQTLIEGLSLQPIVDTGWWAQLIAIASRSALSETKAEEVAALCARLQVLRGGLPMFARLLDATAQPAQPGIEDLIVTFTGSDAGAPALPRITAATHAVNQLWIVLQELARQPADLRLDGYEPGQTALLAFSGPSTAVHELKDLLHSVTEQSARLIRFRPEQRAVATARLLPVTERIARSGRDDAARLRSMVEDGVAAFLRAGCIVQDQRPPETAPQADLQPATPQSMLNQEDAANLAEIILEERRRLWPASGQT